MHQFERSCRDHITSAEGIQVRFPFGSPKKKPANLAGLEVRTKVRQPLPLLGGATTTKGAVAAREGKALLTLESSGALFYL